MTSKSTMVELVTELEKLTNTHHKSKLIELAKSGMFHDFKSEAICGKMYAIDCLDHLLRQSIVTKLTRDDVELVTKLRAEIIDDDKIMNDFQKKKLKEILRL